MEGFMVNHHFYLHTLSNHRYSLRNGVRTKQIAPGHYFVKENKQLKYINTGART